MSRNGRKRERKERRRLRQGQRDSDAAIAASTPADGRKPTTPARSENVRKPFYKSRAIQGAIIGAAALIIAAVIKHEVGSTSRVSTQVQQNSPGGLQIGGDVNLNVTPPDTQAQERLKRLEQQNLEAKEQRDRIEREILALRKDNPATTSPSAIGNAFGDRWAMFYASDSIGRPVEGPLPIEMDWSQARVLTRTPDEVWIQLPDMKVTLPGTIVTIRNFKVGLPNRPDADMIVFGTDKFDIHLRLVAAGQGGVLGVIGATPSRGAGTPG